MKELNYQPISNHQLIETDWLLSDFEVENLLQALPVEEPEAEFIDEADVEKLLQALNHPPVTTPAITTSDIDYLLAIFDRRPAESLPPPIQKIVPPTTSNAEPSNPAVELKSCALPSMPMTEETEMAPTMRGEFMRLQTQLTLAVQFNQMRSVMFCSVGPDQESNYISSQLSQMVAAYSNYKVARFPLAGETPKNALDLAPVHYQLQLRKTPLTNLQEIYSPYGPTLLRSWLSLADREAAMQQMKQYFDLIIFDGPSLATNPEAALLAQQTDGVILVAQRNRTAQAHLEHAKKLLQQARVKILGIVLSNHQPQVSRWRSILKLKK